jgi:Flp pilus assembly protein TadD
VQLNPENDNAHYNLGLAYAKKAATEKAVAHLRKSLQLKPDDPYTLINLAAVLIMNKKSNLYDSSEALKLAERACELTDYKNLEMLGILTKVKNASASKAD